MTDCLPLLCRRCFVYTGVGAGGCGSTTLQTDVLYLDAPLVLSEPGLDVRRVLRTRSGQRVRALRLDTYGGKCVLKVFSLTCTRRR